MADLTKLELQNLRHLIIAHDTAYQKLTAYANNSVDPQIKQMFTRRCTRFVKYKAKIINIFKLGGYFMEEKYMVNDVLQTLKDELSTYERIIPETENIALRQTIQQIRNNDEAFQYELFKVAKVKGYHVQAGKATQEEINKIKDEVNT